MWFNVSSTSQITHKVYFSNFTDRDSLAEEAHIEKEKKYQIKMQHKYIGYESHITYKCNNLSQSRSLRDPGTKIGPQIHQKWNANTLEMKHKYIGNETQTQIQWNWNTNAN